VSDIKDMLSKAFDGNAVDFEDTFSGVMSDKMDAALSSKYDQMFGAMEVDEQELDDEPVEVETEEPELENETD